MILQALMAYAERRSREDPSFADPDLEPVDVTWKLLLDGSGRLITSPMCLSEKIRNKWKPRKLKRPFTSVNEISVRSLDRAKSHFLCDTLQRALLYAEEQQVSDDPLARARHSYFKRLLQEAIEAGACANELRALLKFLEDEAALVLTRKVLASGEPKARNEHNVVFEVGGVDLLKSDTLISFWRKRRAREQTSSGEKQVCLVTGALAVTVETAEKIKGIGGQDTNLISANEKAFWSYGLEKAKNSAISVRAESLTRFGMNELISKSLNIGGAKCLHWTHEPTDDPFDLLATADEGRVAALLKAPLDGTPQSEIGANRFYLLTVSGNGARIVVRDWLDSTLPEVEANVRNWFHHLTIANERDGGTKSAFGLYKILATVVPWKKNKPDFDKLPPQIPAQLLRAALTGGSLPSSLLAAAVGRQNLGGESKLSPARLALIKLYLVRNQSTDPEKRKAMSDQLKQLDPNSTDIADLCGQLFAVIGRLQRHALGKVGTSLAERTYGGVATRPASTLGPVFTKVPAYVKKANSRLPGSGTNRQKEIEVLCGRIKELNKASGAQGFPPSLDLEAQGRFALGYYSYFARVKATPDEAKIEEDSEKLPADSE